MIQSNFNGTQRRSPLSEAQRLNNKKGKHVGVRELAQVLPLTSLIDAFSIIVIYLLIGTQSGGLEISVPKFKLPMAQNSQSLDKSVAILKIENKRFYLNDQPVTLNTLAQNLADLKRNSPDKNVDLMVQADQEIPFSELDPLIKAGSLAGIEKLKFAVLPPK
jgi:biopolymer transport protein ExbD